MNNKILSVFFSVTICFVFACGGSSTNSGYDPDETANYLVTFTSTWSKETHPLDFPSSPHFSGLIGLVHNSSVKLWNEGNLASPGIKQMAETGGKTILSEEIDALIVSSSAYVRLSGSGINPSPGDVSMRLTAHRNYNLVSLVSMIAPSPDWFVGVSGMSLFENGDWVIEKIVELYVYDAGTDSGESFTAANQVTNPPVPIKKKSDYSFSANGTIIPVGIFSFKRL